MIDDFFLLLLIKILRRCGHRSIHFSSFVQSRQNLKVERKKFSLECEPRGDSLSVRNQLESRHHARLRPRRGKFGKKSTSKASQLQSNCARRKQSPFFLEEEKQTEKKKNSTSTLSQQNSPQLITGLGHPRMDLPRGVPDPEEQQQKSIGGSRQGGGAEGGGSRCGSSGGSSTSAASALFLPPSARPFCCSETTTRKKRRTPR